MMNDATQVISRVEEFDPDPNPGCLEVLKFGAVAIMGFGVGVLASFAVMAMLLAS